MNQNLDFEAAFSHKYEELNSFMPTIDVNLAHCNQESGMMNTFCYVK